jgi:hydroxyacylglutathione hydrolase
MKNYTYLIYNSDTKAAILIDPAWDMGRYDDELSKNHLTLTAILLTHHHMDHTNLAGKLATKYKCPVFMSQNEIDFYKFTCENLEAIPMTTKELIFNDIKVKTVFTPGHTYCGTCYWIDNYLFTGDTLFMEGCGMCNVSGGDPSKMFHSLQSLKNLIPNGVLIYPGHQYQHKIGKTFGEVKKMNVYLNFKTEADFMKFRMRKGQKGLLDFT